jgi:peptide/nickel transport system permease protein
LRNSLKLESQKDYFLAAKAKGVSHTKLYNKHALRNAFLPLITLIGNIFPAVISGSFIIEYLFSIPGMGKLSLEAFFSRDYPLIFTILLMAAFLSLLGNLIADLLYQKADPRLNLNKEKA